MRLKIGEIVFLETSARIYFIWAIQEVCLPPLPPKAGKLHILDTHFITVERRELVRA